MLRKKLPLIHRWNRFPLHNYTSHTHTQTDQRNHEPFIKVTFPHCFLPMNLAFPLLKQLFFYKSFALLISKYTALTFAWWNTNISVNTQTLCASPHHLPLVRNPLPYIQWDSHAAWSQGPDTVPIVIGRRAVVGLIQWDTMLFSGHWGGQWGSLCEVCVTQIANCRQKRWAGTGQAQCLHKHIRHADWHKHAQTCGAVGRVDAQKLQRRLHDGVVQ